MAQPEQPWVPTVNDLRVKLCYICREEEQYDDPPHPPVEWVHPCNCTLVAHEKCLLNWIQSSQEEPSRKKKALKCPQCGTTYELESYNPPLLKFLNNLNASAAVAGKVVFACGVAGGVAACASGLYFHTPVQQFLGKEMYDTLLSDDISRWPWHAFANLPLIPISLLFARTRNTTLPLISIGLSLPAHLDMAPSPAMVTVMLPLVIRTYKAMIKRLERWAMGCHTAERRIGRIELALAEAGPWNIRIAADIEREGDHAVQAAEAPANGDQAEDVGIPAVRDPAAAAAETVRITGSSLGRYIANFMGSFLFQLSLRSPALRTFLAIKQLPPVPHRSLPFWSMMNFYHGHSTGTWHQLGLGLRITFNVLLAGTKTWNDADPVWWRNSVGLGMFILMKDCVRILHLSLAKKEIETRRVKSRSFAGIDLKELDLINPPPAAE
ncbi:hypothetical protein BC629DRAFT_1541883 [Irpex lacteus]|nr:hypothetical protein BC629DRAFT_1541883 [Irpex lacteus]